MSVVAIGESFPELLRRDEPPILVPGGSVATTIAPRSAEELAVVMSALTAQQQPALVIGGGTRLGIANPLRGDVVGLSTAEMAGVDEFDAADGVVHARAGTLLSEIAANIEDSGWMLPFDPPGAGATLGGTLASATAGPRQLALGPVRHGVLGLEVVLASGQRAKCGARVVKNVTGYDMAKLYVGSYGTLCVIDAAWLRLRPAPECVVCVAGPVAVSGSGATLAIEAARRSGARAVALLDPALVDGFDSIPELSALARSIDRSTDWLLLCEFAGDEPLCREDASWLAERIECVPMPEGAIDALREIQGEAPEDRVRARLHVLPSRLHACSDRLRSAGAHVMLQPVPGSMHVWLDSRELDTLEAVRRDAHGELILESLPSAARDGRDVFSGIGEGLPLMRALKARFDPDALLNPGRFMGGI